LVYPAGVVAMAGGAVLVSESAWIVVIAQPARTGDHVFLLVEPFAEAAQFDALKIDLDAELLHPLPADDLGDGLVMGAGIEDDRDAWQPRPARVAGLGEQGSRLRNVVLQPAGRGVIGEDGRRDVGVLHLLAGAGDRFDDRP